MDIIYNSLPEIESIDLDYVKMKHSDSDMFGGKHQIVYNGFPLSGITSLILSSQGQKQEPEINFPQKVNEIMRKIEAKFNISATIGFPYEGFSVLDKSFYPAGARLSEHFFRMMMSQSENKVILSLKQTRQSILIFGESEMWKWEISSVYLPKYKSPMTKMHEEINYIYESLKKTNEEQDRITWATGDDDSWQN